MVVRILAGSNEVDSLSTESRTPVVQLSPFSSDGHDGLLIKIQPPREPANRNLHHVPCDLVLSIDVSGSMDSPAPVPSNPGEKQEDSGLSVLDLVKHAARTIMETLGPEDRLGIVTFTSRTKVLQPLTPMTAENKVETIMKIECMRPYDMTNLWHGIRDGLSLFKEGEDGQGSAGRVPALLVLTDGMPNHMCPPQGYIPKLRAMEPLPATIHTFGFGYSLRSGLLKSIAEIGGGNYSFIPDAGMIGTVFVHAVANLQSTFANNAKLRLTYPSYLKLEETTGEAVGKQEPVEVEGDVPEPLTSLTILLSNIQYGQSRDIHLKYGNSLESITAAAETNSKSLPGITAVLEYQHFTPTIYQTVAHQSVLALSLPLFPALDPAEIAYHVSRAALIAFLSTLSPLNAEEEHEPLKHLPRSLPDRLETLAASLPALNPKFSTSHAGCRSLLTDLIGSSSTLTSDDETLGSEKRTHPKTWTGQIALALLHTDYYHRWGVHYLPSLAGAHARQACNSFKDAGPLRYGADSPLFVRCRDRLDAVFDALPAPNPSRVPVPVVPVVSSMRVYNNVGNGCFAGGMMVALAGGRGEVRVGRLRRGMEVATPRGARRVVAVLRMPVRRVEMCLVGSADGKTGLLVTPWHPVSLSSGGVWEFPKDVALRLVRYTGSVYSVLLERDEDADAHAILVGGMWGVTMGHGLTQAGERGDVRVHQALVRLPRKTGGVALGGALTRDPETGLVNGFSRAEGPGKKVTRRLARRAKAAAVAPRPVDKLRPVVRCPTIKYNRRTRLGRGFTLAELKAAGIPKLYAPTIGISVDARRQNLSEEALAANVERLKEYKARLIVFPRKSNKPKKTDTPKDQQTAETTQSIRGSFGLVQPIAAGLSEIKKSDLPKNVEGGAYKQLRKARSDARYVGVREKRVRDKAEAENAKK
ncbi:ribosomal protein L13e-domain-containing protein [Chaetomidium leptoderma]|uniref:60S ribosomal protein L13 n=1 Tax=Chaetomidium leptoderma TaxID=669021 RepID=A0AAN7A0D9_9PEZI|nr:ribosomal protein L13e-domain-containing protein [Chaetomidium leptoderma]